MPTSSAYSLLLQESIGLVSIAMRNDSSASSERRAPSSARPFSDETQPRTQYLAHIDDARQRLRRFQAFLNANFALLPAVKDGWQITPIALWVVGALLILYGYMFASGYAEQVSFLKRLFTA
jgi:hypothetical protein